MLDDFGRTPNDYDGPRTAATHYSVALEAGVEDTSPPLNELEHHVDVPVDGHGDATHAAALNGGWTHQPIGPTLSAEVTAVPCDLTEYNVRFYFIHVTAMTDITCPGVSKWCNPSRHFVIECIVLFCCDIGL